MLLKFSFNYLKYQKIFLLIYRFATDLVLAIESAF